MSAFSKFASNQRDRIAASKPGDEIRQGRAAPVADDLAFIEEAGQVSARLGVITVGAIHINPVGARHAFMWRCYLPSTPALQPARDLDAAKAALRFKVREWCAAAGVVISAAALQRLKSAGPRT